MDAMRTMILHRKSFTFEKVSSWLTWQTFPNLPAVSCEPEFRD